jgi:hypothetical protein
MMPTGNQIVSDGRLLFPYFSARPRLPNPNSKKLTDGYAVIQELARPLVSTVTFSRDATPNPEFEKVLSGCAAIQELGSS